MMMLAPGRPHSASSTAPIPPNTPPAQKRVCPQLYSILMISHAVDSCTAKRENTTGTLAAISVSSVILATKMLTR